MSKIRIRMIDPKGLEEVKNNDGYCKCALVKEPDTKCMCTNFKNSIPDENNPSVICHCGVYEKYLED